MKKKHYTRLVSCVTIVTIVSMFSAMVTDLQQYWRKELSQGISISREEFNGDFIVNNFGDNINKKISPNRQRNASESELKYILFWNEAYGSKEYDLGFGREPFYENLCEETRCFATDNRSLMPVEEFDAVFFHQRSLDFHDVPAKRSPRQRYVHYIMESAQYLYMDINTMNNFFNWTMTYRRDSDFYRPYARIVQIKPHPTGPELDEFIKKFGRDNKHLAAGKHKQAAWFVSHCATQARREKYVKQMKKLVDVDVYGKCGKLKCSRANETGCYLNLEQNYKFYLSFENSVCVDYVTEKFFNVLKYQVLPVTYSGADFTEIAPPHSYINTLDFNSVSDLSKYLLKVDKDDELYASYFWWKEFYEIRNTKTDLSQSFCDMCKALHSPLPDKIYSDLAKWWVTASKCKKLKLS